MKKRVGVIGAAGYVGRGMFAMFDGHPSFEAIAVDKLHSHLSPQDYRGFDLAIVCVPTPSRLDGSCDTSIVEEVCELVDAPLVLIKSTVPPGTTERLNIKNAEQWGRFHFSPEYMGEPLNFVPYWRYPDPHRPERHNFCIVGGPQAPAILDYFAKVMGPHARLHSTDTTTAELVKYMENAFFAVKVTFVNEFSRLAHAFDVQWHELRQLWLLDSRVEPDHTHVFANAPGWGGKCLPKDISAICHIARQMKVPAHLLEAIQAINAIHRNLLHPGGLSTRELVQGLIDAADGEMRP